MDGNNGETITSRRNFIPTQLIIKNFEVPEDKSLFYIKS